MSVRAVIWDIGGVLVDWQPHLAWSAELGEEGARAFMERIGFAALNLRADGGELFADLAREIDDDEDAARLAAYPALYPRTVQGRVTGSWDVLDDLTASGIPVHAITNWSAETWPVGLEVHPRLGNVFGTLVVSGRERMLKPEAAIFDLLCERAGLAPSECLFVDDGLHNVEGARAVGMAGHHFGGAARLRADLTERGLL
ncbi:HAD family phosphatase [Roseobacter sp. HKCCA0434]|uniref:HAD family hydrolase n=1 Tax=Roseobacter sp. HKCCA0434 TaxID=3079297 RepID=UPI002905DF2F|nr:HAD family phosphatase [Roseobacter sp. HKCCA0434]